MKVILFICSLESLKKNKKKQNYFNKKKRETYLTSGISKIFYQNIFDIFYEAAMKADQAIPDVPKTYFSKLSEKIIKNAYQENNVLTFINTDNS